MNFRDCSCEEDEKQFRLLREITTSLSSSTSDFFVELVTRSFWQEIVNQDFREKSYDGEKRIDKIWADHK
jgi:hypothetical protein